MTNNKLVGRGHISVAVAREQKKAFNKMEVSAQVFLAAERRQRMSSEEADTPI